MYNQPPHGTTFTTPLYAESLIITRTSTWQRWITGWAAAAVLLTLYLLAGITAAKDKSPTFDESAHLPAGYVIWTLNDYRLNPANGNFPKRWATLPLLISSPQLPDRQSDSWRASQQWRFGYEFLFQSGNDVQAIFTQARAMVALLGAALGLLVYVWSRHMFGQVGGIISLTLYCLSPTMLAHGTLVTSDMAVALSFVAATGAAWWVLHRVSIISVAACALAVSLLLLCKMSAVLIFVIVPVLLLVRLSSRRPLELRLRSTHLVHARSRQLTCFFLIACVTAVVAFTLIWASFGFRYEAMNQPAPGVDHLSPDWPDLSKQGAAGAMIAFARDNRLLPEAYLFGFALVRSGLEQRPAFLNGEYSMTGWASFFPFAVLFKTPLPVFVFLALALAAIVLRWRGETDITKAVRRSLYHAAPLLTLFVLYWLVAVGSRLNIGHRHVLPTYPVMFIFAGAAAWWIVARVADERKPVGPNAGTTSIILARVMVAGMLLWMGVESARIWPNHLAYFNQLVGGPQHGYRHLVDSSLDWGQDLPALKHRLDEQRSSPDHAHTPVYLSYFGTGDPRYYGIDAYDLPGFFGWHRDGSLSMLAPGIYCISATMLQGVYHDPMGPWTDEHEQMLQWASAQLGDGGMTMLQREGEAQRIAYSKDDAGRNALLSLYDRLRFAKLCDALREREPDAMAGYSILIYRVDEAQLKRALFR